MSGPGARTGYAIAPSDGSPLFYEVVAPEHPAATVLLCDGIGCDGFVWKRLTLDLAERYRVIHWHYRGHGRSPRPRDPRRITTEDFADDLAAVLDENEIEKAIVAGHSMGVQVALEAYRRHGSRFEALLLVCGAPGYLLKTFRNTSGFGALLPSVRKTVERAPRIFNAISRTIVPTRLAWKIATRLEIDRELIDPLDFMPYLRSLSRVEVDYFIQVLEHAAAHSAEDMLESIEVPTLVLAGERDGFTPHARSTHMVDSIPNAELLTIERGTHTAPLEQPEVVAEAVLDFLARRVDGGS